MKKIIYILGNPLLKEDSLPLKILPTLQKSFPDIEFIHIDPTEEYSEDNANPIFLDTVVGIDQVKIFDNLNSFSPSPSVSVHDFDLYISLKLLMKLGKVKSVKIIGIPSTLKIEEIIKEMKNLLPVQLAMGSD